MQGFRIDGGGGGGGVDGSDDDDDDSFGSFNDSFESSDEEYEGVALVGEELLDEEIAEFYACEEEEEVDEEEIVKLILGFIYLHNHIIVYLC